MLRRLILPLAVLALTATARVVSAQVIRGSVKELASKGTLEGISVSLLNAKDSVLRTVVTGADGKFRFPVPGAGEYSVSLRALGFEPMITTPFVLGPTDDINIDLQMMRSAVQLDTIAVKASNQITNVTPGRTQFLEHYRDGRGMFLSGLEIAASKKGLAEYVSTMPGFADYTAGKATDRSASECQGLNDELRGVAASLTASKRSARAEFERRDDLCALRDEAGRTVYAMDAPCVTSQVDRIGLVKRVEGTDLVVHRYQKIFTPYAGNTFNDADTVAPAEIIIHLADVIAVEFYQKPTDIPKALRIRGRTSEAEVMTAKCAHIQFWTRTAW